MKNILDEKFDEKVPTLNTTKKIILIGNILVFIVYAFVTISIFNWMQKVDFFNFNDIPANENLTPLLFMFFGFNVIIGFVLYAFFSASLLVSGILKKASHQESLAALYVEILTLGTWVFFLIFNIMMFFLIFTLALIIGEFMDASKRELTDIIIILDYIYIILFGFYLLFFSKKMHHEVLALQQDTIE